ncbi:hypothetical protein [Dapis sp. BLCC M172]|uniref:hypothetical protein n=1 Tax=Dapis sp. BLCC M172 TaxID=2975281 RepID=UPI003CF10519
MLKIAIEGLDSVQVAEEILAIEGIEGSYETINEVEREGTLATIATIVGIVGGSLTIAEQLHKLKGKYQKSLEVSSIQPRIEKVMIVSGEKRLLLKDATVEQIKHILES